MKSVILCWRIKYLINDQCQHDDLSGYAVWDWHIPLQEETAALAGERSVAVTWVKGWADFREKRGWGIFPEGSFHETGREAWLPYRIKHC